MSTTNTYAFTTKTQNGISVIFETTSGYFNASRMCSDNGKHWRNFTRTQYWKNKLEAFKRSSFYKDSKGARIGAPSFHAQIGVKPQFQGEFVHPKLIHFVAEWCNDDYAFKVAELMDSINDRVHQQLEEKKLEDTVENSRQLFISTCESVTDLVSSWSPDTWGVRDQPKTDFQAYHDLNNAIKCLYTNKARLKSGGNKYAPVFNAVDEASKHELQVLEKKKKLTHANKDRLVFLLTAEYRFMLEQVKLQFKDDDNDYNKQLVDDLNNKFKEEHRFDVTESKLLVWTHSIPSFFCVPLLMFCWYHHKQEVPQIITEC